MIAELNSKFRLARSPALCPTNIPPANGNEDFLNGEHTNIRIFVLF